MQPDQLKYLIEQQFAGEATAKEKVELIHLLKEEQNKEAFSSIVTEMLLAEQSYPDSGERWDWMVENILSMDQNEYERVELVKIAHRIHFLKTAWLRYAAAVLLVLGADAYLLITRHENEKSGKQASIQSVDIAPGGNKALLTLADGSIIVLDSATNGTIAQQGNSSIVKLPNGQITYDSKGQASGETMMNTMRTPKGGQYQLTLPDGTRMWLNAASSITYPVVFTGRQRSVMITGEAYFEVAKDKKPFIVDVNGKSLVEVLGTHFNVNGYADEDAIKTTLLEGSVRITNEVLTQNPGKLADVAVILKPGQQAEVREVAGKNLPVIINTMDNVAMDKVIAWKNGVFVLQNSSLTEVMRQLARWYDIEIRYEGTIPAVQFQGKLDRGVRLSSVIRWFSDLGINSRLEGRTLVVSGK